MRLLFAIDDLSTGGAQRQLITIALAMKARGHLVEFFYYHPSDFLIGDLRAAGILTHYHLKHSRYSLKVFRNLRNVIQNGNFDIVMSFLPTPNFYSIMATRFVTHKPVVIVSERLSDPDDKIPLKLSLIRQSYRWADHITTNSRNQHNQLIKKQPWLKKKISVIYNGYDLERFHQIDCKPSGDPLKLLVIGRVVPNKNGSCLIKALSILREQYNIYPQVDWVGEHFGQHSEELNDEIAALNLQSQWNWLYQRDDITYLMNQHDLLVHPSYNEGLPNVVCEALACGRPVIVSNIQDNPYLVADGVSGYLFDWQDPHDLAKKLFNFHTLSSQERSEMGSRGRQFAEKNLSLNRLADEYESLFNRLINRAS